MKKSTLMALLVIVVPIGIAGLVYYNQRRKVKKVMETET